MSKKGVVVVIGLAVVDQKYRSLLQNNPSDAMARYELTGEERRAIAGMDFRPLEKLADTLNHRLREWFVGWASR